ncbi:unnamed protein product [Diatraea saccharalis]|uniref:SANT domain-containing protein n=1 Tax=Diatraea saccharalis TaxID=40085 RepID=A0A9N9QX55_9NEOP|nr:unnamed protein product [Diatraea saccharalis]
MEMEMDCGEENEILQEKQNQNTGGLEGWTKCDKFDLLQALKIYGSHHYEEIQKMMPHKSINEIKTMIEYYRQKAKCHPSITEKTNDKKIIHSISKVPLAMWAKLLTESLNFNELQTETVSALRLIADLEEIPSPVCTNNVDFKEIYLTIANAMEGKTLPDDPTINSILEKCIIETAYTSKSFIRNTSLRNVLDSINISEKEIISFPRPTDNIELATLRHLVAQRNYNPLNISEEHLKPSLHAQPK